MKLAIFGNTRSGTTMLTAALWQHLRYTLENESWSNLLEVLRPRFGRGVAQSRIDRGGNVVVERDGHLQKQWLQQLPSISNFRMLPDNPKIRFMKFSEYAHQDYLIKLMSADLRDVPEIVPWMRDNYRTIAIERRNPLASFLSTIIADKHNRWHSNIDIERVTYTPFVADMHHVGKFGYTFTHYYRYRDELNPTHVLYYEDIAYAPPEDIIRMAGMKPLPIKYESHRTTKLHSFQEKKDLISNYDEVKQYFETIMEPYDVTMEHNDL